MVPALRSRKKVKVWGTARNRVYHFSGGCHAKNAAGPEVSRVCLLLKSAVLEMALACGELIGVKVQIRCIADKKVIQLKRVSMVIGACVCVIISVIIIKNRAVREIHSHYSAAVI